MTKLPTRAAALIGAGLFLVTSLGFSGLVIWQMVKEHNQNKTSQSAQDALNKNNSGAANNNESKEGKLEGTKLADFTPVAKVETLQKIDTTPGSGQEVKAGDTVTAHYTGAVAATGVIFQSSHDSGEPIPFSLDQVIQGWKEGVPGMKAGGKRRLLIPAAMAYGASPPSGSNIPPNADLVFDIELVKVGQ